MSGQSFRSVFMVASCAGAALGCYLISLRVASERAALEEVETEIVLAQRDIRLLQTEIGTRGRLAQLERWNVNVLALSAPTADQFLDGGFALARLVAPPRAPNIDAPVVLASAPAPQTHSAPLEEGGQPEVKQGANAAAGMLHQASLKSRPALAVEETAQKPSTNPAEEVARPKPAKRAPSAQAANDPLAPLPQNATSLATAKESGSAR